MENRWVYPEESQGKVVHLACGSESVARIVFLSSNMLRAFLFIKAMALDFSEFYDAVDGISGLKPEHKEVFSSGREDLVAFEENEDLKINLSFYILGRTRQEAESFAREMRGTFPGEVVETLFLLAEARDDYDDPKVH